MADYTKPPKPGHVFIDVNSGGGSTNLTIGDHEISERVAGPKAWGGSNVVHRFEVSVEDLRRLANEYDTENQNG